MKILIGAVIGCAVFFFLNAYIQNDIAWLGLRYNNGIEGSTDTDSVDRIFALVFFAVFGWIGAKFADQR